MNLHVPFSSYELPVFDVSDGKMAGHATLDGAIFGLIPREDIIHRVVRWQTAKRFGAIKSTLGRSDVARTGKKIFKQKGTGRARHSSAKAPQFRGGGRAFGGLAVKAESYLPKKVRALGLRHALSSKALDDELILVQNLTVREHKTRAGKEALRRLGVEGKRCLIVYGEDIDLNFALATRNIPDVDLISAGGLNVYDILNHERLLLSREAVKYLDERFSCTTDWSSDSDAPPTTILVPNVPRKGIATNQKYKLIAPDVKGDRKKVPSEYIENNNAFHIQVLLDLASKDLSTRRQAMKKLVASPSKFRRSDLKARLLPLLLSSDAAEAMDAAITLARLTYPEHYPKLVALAAGHEGKYLDRVRKDLEHLMQEEGILCFTYADTLERHGDVVLIQLRLSPELPFELDGRPARVENRAWQEHQPKFNVVVTGADDPKLDWSKEKGADHAKALLKCNVSRKGVSKLFLDFFADSRWISRQELSV